MRSSSQTAASTCRSEARGYLRSTTGAPTQRRATMSRARSARRASCASAVGLGGYPALWTSESGAEERSVGKECGSTCRSRWSLYQQKQKKKTTGAQYGEAREQR